MSAEEGLYLTASLLNDGSVSFVPSAVRCVDSTTHYFTYKVVDRSGVESDYAVINCIMMVQQSARHNKYAFVGISSGIFNGLLAPLTVDDQCYAAAPIAQDDKWVKMLVDYRKWKYEDNGHPILQMNVGQGAVTIAMTRAGETIKAAKVQLHVRFSASVVNVDGTINAFSDVPDGTHWRIGMSVFHAQMVKVVTDDDIPAVMKGGGTRAPLNPAPIQVSHDEETIKALTALGVYNANTGSAPSSTADGGNDD